MGISTKFEPIDVTAFFDPGFMLPPAVISQELARFAQQEFLKADRFNTQQLGRQLSSEVYVDGLKGGDIFRVRPDGTIVYEWDLENDIVRWCYEEIVQASPVLTGRYKASHAIFADGNQVTDLSLPVSAQEWVITSLVPYARKIEGRLNPKPDWKTHGKYATGPISTQAPDGVYHAIAALAKARYGNSANITFTYRAPIAPGSMLERWAQKHSAKMQGSSKQRRQHSRDIRQPAIVISFR